ncbi:MAG: DUF3048 domain-containing protein, partial [Acutalibacteraceae bacterium]
MFKKFLAAICCVALIFMVGCDNDVVYDNLSNYDNATTESSNLLVNPLTGADDVSKEAASRRPVAIMVNNVKTAQKVQTGLNEADIIYETEVEGGITRLLAVYQDISNLDKIGTVRSARYPYVDLALGHNAIYIHCGQDPTYCAPHLKDIDDLSIDTKSKGAKRISNGLSSEHTLYAIAGDLWENINENFDTKASNNTPWANFTSDALTLDGGSATSVSVPFPTISTNFTYDAQSGLYTRLSGGTVLTDYYTGEQTQVKNVFVLLTSITNYPDGKHRQVALDSGDGYYVTN